MTSTVRLRRIPSKLGFCYTMDNSALDILLREWRFSLDRGKGKGRGKGDCTDIIVAKGRIVLRKFIGVRFFFI